MANTYSSLFFHIVFSTKYRESWISEDIESRMWAYIGGIARKHKCSAIQIGGIEDHIHSLILSPPIYAPCDIAKFLKGESSKWVHDEFSGMRRFSWQDGYSAFSVSKSAVPKVVDYIKNQRQHHQSQSFEDEYLELLRLHDVDPGDQQYIFG